ncbi:hypothetical protein [Neolewinella aurantiaca]|nr:hypothetical protein [Neolewinella aurantiaca]
MYTTIIIYAVLFLIGAGPALVAMLGFLLGNLLGCNINEAGTDPCVRNGVEWGETLSSMVVFGWLTIVTFPLAACAAIGYTVYLFL